MIVLLIATLFAHFPVDAADLWDAARESGVPGILMTAIAIKETGYAGGNAYLGPGQDSAGVRVCREIGRLQVRPCDNWGWLSPHCRHLTVYRSNIRCGAAILALRHVQTGSWSAAIERYNGKSAAARKYREQVELLIGQLTISEADHAETN